MCIRDRHWIITKPSIFQIKEYKNEDDKDWYTIKLITMNYFEDKTGEIEAYLEEEFKRYNNITEEEFKNYDDSIEELKKHNDLVKELKKYNDIMRKQKINKDAKWFFEITKNIKKLENKLGIKVKEIFTSIFPLEIQKDGTKKLKLIISIPAQESLKESKTKREKAKKEEIL